MIATKHTPGTWNSHCPVPELNTIAAVSSSHGMHICDVSSYGASPETRNANARLIAASPDLLEALERLLKAYEDKYGVIVQGDTELALAVFSARLAITKAKSK